MTVLSSLCKVIYGAWGAAGVEVGRREKGFSCVFTNLATHHRILGRLVRQGATAKVASEDDASKFTEQFYPNTARI